MFNSILVTYNSKPCKDCLKETYHYKDSCVVVIVCALYIPKQPIINYQQQYRPLQVLPLLQVVGVHENNTSENEAARTTKNGHDYADDDVV